jgi:hypothetical protein
MAICHSWFPYTWEELQGRLTCCLLPHSDNFERSNWLTLHPWKLLNGLVA